MSFGLKNVGATYQWLVNKVFADKIGRTMKVYVDDIIVKSPTIEKHVDNLANTFASLRLYNMRLNLEKCTFGVEAGKFLGYMESHRGIKTNLEKIQVVLDMSSPKSNKGIQKLAWIAVHNRFVSKFVDKCLIIFKLLRNTTWFVWDDHYEKTFIKLKAYLSSPPL